MKAKIEFGCLSAAILFPIVVSVLSGCSEPAVKADEPATELGCMDYKYDIRAKAASRIMTAIGDNAVQSYDQKNVVINPSINGDGQEIRIWFTALDKDGEIKEMLATGPIDTDTCEVGIMTGQVGGLLHDGVTPTFSIK